MRFSRQLEKALRPDGWRPSEAEPLFVPPAFGTFVQLADDGWACVLRAVRYARNDLYLPWWPPGAHGAVEVRAWVTFPAAERLAAHLGLCDADFGLDVAPPFDLPGQVPGYRQFRGPEDDERVLEDVRRYARDVVLSAVERRAGLDTWLAVHEAVEASNSRAVPVMLLAHGRTDESLRRLHAAQSERQRADDGAFAAFVERVERFVRSGAELPTAGTALTTVAPRTIVRPVRPDPVAPAEDADSSTDSRWTSKRVVILAMVVVGFAWAALDETTGIRESGPGWGWLPAAVAVVCIAAFRLAERSEELREGWRERAAHADRVERYLERKRLERSSDTVDEDAGETSKDADR